ncbi:hypothetical protein SLEP1_g2229 [Rubroshorea leprosula]|uniref:Uncharacterized protein n=1 Tax=Rubroshorea leprosula TaxID=152421 RepID=A0AAV5HQ75_9ROSI|nr:hypothetical protein SLEP1_g2229 [Rubroshorea leprosula]
MSKEALSGVEWRINVPDGTSSKILVRESGLVSKIKGLLGGLIFTVWRFLVKAWSLGKAEPEKVVHGLKLGLTISIVSLLVTGTFVAGALGLGIHWLADHAGQKAKPVILAISVFLFGCVAEYFKENGKIKEDDEDHSKKIQGYKCVLNSKASEESLVEPILWDGNLHMAASVSDIHGNNTSRVKIGASVRNCAYCIETLNACLSSEIQAPTCIKSHLSDVSMRLCSYSAHVLTELATMIKTMTKSSTLDVLVAVQELQDALKSHTNPYMAPELLTAEGPGDASGEPITKSGTPLLLEIIPLVTTVSLLIEIALRIGGVVDAVEELTCLTAFKACSRSHGKTKENQTILQ